MILARIVRGEKDGEVSEAENDLGRITQHRLHPLEPPRDELNDFGYHRAV